MTRRERLERKAERRREWAEKAQVRSQAASNTAHAIASGIPFGQPILVGHHSERHHRRDIARMDSNMRKAVENDKLANHHSSAAAGIEHALDHSIFSDDDDAIQALEARIQEREQERARMVEINKLFRKKDAAGLTALGLNFEQLQEQVKTQHSWNQKPYAGYELSNLGGRITADRKRLEQLKKQKARKDRAEAAVNGVILDECGGGYCVVTFAEKPDLEILTALKANAFSWASGSWVGKLENLPGEVRGLLPVADVAAD